jgi:beta-glucanase (GH16 family)
MRRLFSPVVAAILATAAPAARAEEWRLVWADEFDAPAVDPTRWSLETDCWGGGNAERQCYTASLRNAAVRNGKLVITARRERATGPALPLAQRSTAADPQATATREYSSARLTTRGKAAWRYGRIEVRASLPQGQGMWPAIWMLPEDDAYGPWAASGEIDILEAVNLGVACKVCSGGREDTILGTLHFGAPWPDNAHSGDDVHFPGALSGFHTYAVEWDENRIAWQVDGRTYAERGRSAWWSSGSKTPGAPFDRPFHLILNLAIGGRLAEERGITGMDPRGFPKRFAVDWVRVWQKMPNPVTPTGRSGEGSR